MSCPRYTNQPKRGLCPACGKRGIGPWLRVSGDFITTFPARVRSCRYCRTYVEREIWQSGAGGDGLGAFVPNNG